MTEGLSRSTLVHMFIATQTPPPEAEQTGRERRCLRRAGETEKVGLRRSCRTRFGTRLADHCGWSGDPRLHWGRSSVDVDTVGQIAPNPTGREQATDWLKKGADLSASGAPFSPTPTSSAGYGSPCHCADHDLWYSGGDHGYIDYLPYKPSALVNQ
jgi:hypothetical protein